MKVSGNGQAKILTASELQQLFSDGLTSTRDKCLFAICLFTGCRISEALSLQKSDIKNQTITFRKSTTKGKLKTRTIDTPVALSQYLDEYEPPLNEYNPYLFPSREGKHLTRISADKILRAACNRKHCREWNSFVKQRTKLRKAGKIEEANQLEQEYLTKLDARAERRLVTRSQKRKQK